MRDLPRVLKQMGGYGILPRAETCDKLLAACVRTNELDTAREVLALAKRAGHALDPKGIAAFEKKAARLSGGGGGSSSSSKAKRPQVSGTS